MVNRRGSRRLLGVTHRLGPTEPSRALLLQDFCVSIEVRDTQLFSSFFKRAASILGVIRLFTEIGVQYSRTF